MEKRLRGRPKKKEGSIEPWQFGRVAKVTSAYDDARKRGEKHSVAIREAVDSLRLSSPERPISETEVRRILSTYRPRGSGIILHFERSVMSEADIQRHRRLRDQIAALQEKKGLTLPPLPAYDETRPREKFTIRYAARPDYPRHNRKTLNE